MTTKCSRCTYLNAVAREANVRSLEHALERDNYRVLIAEVINYLEPRIQSSSIEGPKLLRKLAASLIRKESP